MKLFLFLALILVPNSIFCQVNTTTNKTKETKIINSRVSDNSTNCKNKNEIKINVFQMDQGWGFDILVNHKKYIHQTNIPAINDLKAFKTKKDALKIAALMKSKICKNIIPPSLTLQEIDSLLPKN